MLIYSNTTAGRLAASLWRSYPPTGKLWFGKAILDSLVTPPLAGFWAFGDIHLPDPEYWKYCQGQWSLLSLLIEDIYSELDYQTIREFSPSWLSPGWTSKKEMVCIFREWERKGERDEVWIPYRLQQQHQR